MNSRSLKKVPLMALALLAVMLVAAPPAQAIRVVTYNILNWPSFDIAGRYDDHQVVMDALDADIIIVQEIESQNGVNNYLTYCLNATVPGEYGAALFVNGPDTDNAIFYKNSVVDTVTSETIYTDVRWTMDYTVQLEGYTGDAGQLHLLSTHLKAGSSSSDEDVREDQCNDIRAHMNAYPSGTNFIFGGDLNVYSSSDAGYQVLLASQADNDGRCFDPINQPGSWHDSYTYRHIHTQSPRETSTGSYTGGGMDDRFDQLLISASLEDGSGMDYVVGSHTAYGNDGYRLNGDINDPVNQVVSAAIADALYYASDHIPVYLELQLPAILDVASTLDFGRAIIASGANENLTVGNAAFDPAEELAYSFTAPVGFDRPGGTFYLDGEQTADHIISMLTATVGVKSGDLTVTSNAPENAIQYVALTGTVVDHAVPSLDGSSVVLLDTLDFGVHEVGTFTDMTAAIFNLGYDSLQALLEVYEAEIVGDSEFTIVGGFTPFDVAGTEVEFDVHFDDTGGIAGTYEADLTFSTRDESGIHGGGGALSDLVVHLTATIDDGNSVGDEPVAMLALGRGAPNPFADVTTLRFSMPQPAHARVDVFDIAGRLVADIHDGSMPAGVHEIVWDGRDSHGRAVASGIYFCRAEVGEWSQIQRMVLLR